MFIIIVYVLGLHVSPACLQDVCACVICVNVTDKFANLEALTVFNVSTLYFNYNDYSTLVLSR